MSHGLLRADNDAQLLRGALLAHGADEAETFAQHGADQALLLAAVTDRMARRIHAGAQRRFRDNASTPDGREQIILADHVLAVAEQVFQ